jgi:DNA polymerase-3 subunit epsilon
MQTCVAIDFETADYEKNSACSLGLAVLEDFKIVESRYWLIKPPTSYFRPMLVDIHGLHWEDVKDSPAFNEIWHEIAPYFSGRMLFAHNAGFDIAVLRTLIKFYKLSCPKITYFDTLQLSKAAWKHLSSHKLNMLAQYLGKEFQHHNALEDAKMCANVVSKIAEENEVSDIMTLLRRYSLKIKKM